MKKKSIKYSPKLMERAVRLAGQDRSAFGKLACKHGFSQTALFSPDPFPAVVLAWRLHCLFLITP